MSDNRQNRDLETRDKTTRKAAWTPPTVLPDPIPEAGYKFRWIRVATNGNSDATNVSSKIREGWVPVRADKHPEIYTDAVSDDRFKDNVIVGGLMLCKAPQEMIDQRTEYYDAQAAGQIMSVDKNLMNESDARMPLFNERKTKVTFGNGN
jgi:hypothetical protein